jgi:hypothetical protein
MDSLFADFPVLKVRVARLEGEKLEPQLGHKKLEAPLHPTLPRVRQNLLENITA